MIAIPIELAGAPAGIPARFNQLAFEIEGSEGDRYEMRLPAMIGPPEKPLLAVWLHRYDQTSWQIIRMDRAIYNRLQKAKVRIRGKIVANFYRVGPPPCCPSPLGASFPKWEPAPASKYQVGRPARN